MEQSGGGGGGVSGGGAAMMSPGLSINYSLSNRKSTATIAQPWEMYSSSLNLSLGI